MPEHTHTGEAPVTLNEGTRLDLKTMVLVVSGALATAGAIGRSEIAMVRLDAELRAQIESVRVEGRDENRTQDARSAVTENRLANIEATTCAIARSLKVPTVGCSRGREDDR